MLGFFRKKPKPPEVERRKVERCDSLEDEAKTVTGALTEQGETTVRLLKEMRKNREEAVDAARAVRDH